MIVSERLVRDFALNVAHFWYRCIIETDTHIKVSFSDVALAYSFLFH